MTDFTSTVLQQETCIMTPDFGATKSDRPLMFMIDPYSNSPTREIKRALTQEPGKKSASYDPKKLSLLLDLDNTLVDVRNYVVPNAIEVELGDEINPETYYAVKRPFVDEFVSKLSDVYNLFIYTAAEKTYAHKILKAVGLHKYIYRVFHRKYCVPLPDYPTQKFVFKLGFKSHNTILIDDSIKQVRAQLENSILISRFDGDLKDSELQKLLPFLLSFSSVKDVRPVTVKYFEYCSKQLEKPKRKSKTRSSHSPSLRKAVTMQPPSSELGELDDFDGGKAFEGKSFTMNNPMENMKRRILIEHLRSLKDQAPLGRDTILQIHNRSSGRSEEEETEPGNLPSSQPTPKKLDNLSFRARFTPLPVLYQNPSCDIEVDCLVD